MLKVAVGVLGVLCCGVAGCADLRLRHTALSHDAAPAVPAVNQPDPLYLAEQASYVAEYAPWRVRARRRAVEQLTPREADPLSELETKRLLEQGPEGLALVLQRRREENAKVNAAQAKWLNEVEKEARELIASICTGC
jgi:hypothetical protein